MVRQILGYWSQKVDFTGNGGDISEIIGAGPACPHDSYQFLFDFDGTNLVYSSWLHCHPFDSGNWGLSGNNLILMGQPDQNRMGASENVTINGNTLTLSDEGVFKRFTGDPLIDKLNKETIQRWDEFVNKK
jgi:hypothetical protein